MSVPASLQYEVDLLSKLVALDTDAVSKRQYVEGGALIVDEAQRCGLTAEIVDGEAGAKDGVSRPNVLVTLPGDSDVTVLLESHFDVVPPGPKWTYPPFQVTVKEGKAYGRGTADNKAGIVAAFGALRQLTRENREINLTLIAGVDEEIGGRYGVDYVLSEYGISGDAALVLDAGPESLYVGASGILWGKITVKGQQGHAGYPYKATNAIEESRRLLTALDPYRQVVEQKRSVLHAPVNSPREFVWGRYTITMIQAGEKENIIPGTCEIRFDRRLLPEESTDQAETELRSVFQQALDATGCDATLTVIHKQPGYHTPATARFVQTVRNELQQITGQILPLAGELGGNDGTFFAKHGIPVVCYGPIRADTCYHGIDEFVYLEDIRHTRELILNLGKVAKDQIT